MYVACSDLSSQASKESLQAMALVRLALWFVALAWGQVEQPGPAPPEAPAPPISPAPPVVPVPQWLLCHQWLLHHQRLLLKTTRRAIEPLATVFRFRTPPAPLGLGCHWLLRLKFKIRKPLETLELKLSQDDAWEVLDAQEED